MLSSGMRPRACSGRMTEDKITFETMKKINQERTNVPGFDGLIVTYSVDYVGIPNYQLLLNSSVA